MSRTRTKNRLGRLVIFMMAIIMIGVLLSAMSRLYKKNQVYAEREAELMAQLAAEQERAQELIEYEIYVGSKEYVEAEARNKLDMIYENEIIFREKQGP